MPLTDDLSKLARSANGIFNSITANATAITSMSVGGTTINASGVSGNSNVFVGNSTVNAVVNATSLTIANSTVTYSYTAPTAAQQSNTTFFLNANGSWASAGGTGGANTTITSSNTLTASSLKIVSVAMANVGQSVTLPSATTLTTGGPIFVFVNKGLVEFGIRDAAGALIGAVGSTGDAECYLEDNSTTAGAWSIRGSNLLPAIRSFEYTFPSTYRSSSYYSSSVNVGSGRVNSIIRLTDNLSLGSLQSTTGQVYVFAIDHSTTPDTIGTPVLVNATAAAFAGAGILYKISSSKAALVMTIGTTTYVYNVTVSGTTCTVSSAATSATAFSNPAYYGSSLNGSSNYGSAGFGSYATFVGVNSDVLVLAGVVSNVSYAQAFNCSGTNPVAGTVLNIGSAPSGVYLHLLALSPTTAIVATYDPTATPATHFVSLLTFSGTTISQGSTTTLNYIAQNLFKLSSNTVISYTRGATGDYSNLQSIQISGTTCSLGANLTLGYSGSYSYPLVRPYFNSFSNTLFCFNYTDGNPFSSLLFDRMYSYNGSNTVSNTNLGFVRYAPNTVDAYRTPFISNNSFLYNSYKTTTQYSSSLNSALIEMNLSGNTFSNGNIYQYPPNYKPYSSLSSFGNNGLIVYPVPAIDTDTVGNSYFTAASFAAFRYTTSNGLKFLGTTPIALPLFSLNLISSPYADGTASSSYYYPITTDGYTTSNGSNKFTVAGATSMIGINPANSSYSNSAVVSTPMINVLEFIV